MVNFLDWAHLILSNYPLAAPVVFVGLNALMAVFFLPCSWMTLTAGALWGEAYGLVISMVAAIVSLATTFLLSRSFLHRRIECFIMHRHPNVAGLAAQAAVYDWKLIAATQLNPLVPASVMCYGFGISRVSFAKYLLFSGAFMIPLQVLFVLTGHSVTGSITSKESLRLAWC